MSLAFAVPATAQLCAGAASFGVAPVQFSAAGAWEKNANSFGAGFGLGGAGPFAQLSYFVTSYDQFEASSHDVGIAAGWQFAVDPDGDAVFHLCPLVQLVHTSGLDSINVGTATVDLSQTATALGFSLGGVIGKLKPNKIIPSGSFAMVSTKTTTTNSITGASSKASETAGVVELGIGVLLGDLFSIRPNVAWSFGLDTSSHWYGVSMSVNFPKRVAR
jgi:hypothetical protein